ncbi:MAG: hypothetical protein GF364_14735 [Candidatus Lokiarchaeota archaeon]|nr:hypothetical protein [Candidatus Lokiarchaeota archaeon]
MHIYLDGVMNNNGRFYLIPTIEGLYDGLKPRISDFIALWSDSAIGIESLATVIVGVLFIVGFINFFVYFLKTSDKRVILYSVLYLTAFLICFYLFGNKMTEYHADAGAIFYVSIFWLFPLSLCVLSTKQIGRNKKSDRDANETELNKEKDKSSQGVKKVNSIIIGLYYLFSVLFMIGGLLLLFVKEPILNIITSYSSFWNAYLPELSNVLFGLAIMLLIFGLINAFIGKKMRSTDNLDMGLVIIESFYFVSGFLGFLVLVGGLNIAEPAVDYVFSEFGSEIPADYTPDLILSILPAVSIVLGILGVFNYLCGMGLLLKSEKWWKIMVIYNGALLFMIYPLSICCYLNENRIKQLYKTRKSF